MHNGSFSISGWPPPQQLIYQDEIHVAVSAMLQLERGEHNELYMISKPVPHVQLNDPDLQHARETCRRITDDTAINEDASTSPRYLLSWPERSTLVEIIARTHPEHPTPPFDAYFRRGMRVLLQNADATRTATARTLNILERKTAHMKDYTTALAEDFKKLLTDVPNALGLFDSCASDTGSPDIRDFCMLRKIEGLNLEGATYESGTQPVQYTGTICTSIQNSTGEGYTHLWQDCIYHTDLRDRLFGVLQLIHSLPLGSKIVLKKECQARGSSWA